MTPASRYVPALATLLLAFLALSFLPSAALGQANVKGQWQTLPNLMPINPIHVALMHNGKVLVVSGSGNVATNTNFQAGVFDPQTGTVTTQAATWDMFCNGMVVLPDGRVFVNGGTLQYDPFHGEPRTSVYDPATGLFTDLQSMAHGRWYPTVTVLGDGTVMTFSGLTETVATNTAVEVYTVGTGWSQEFGASWTPPTYPRMTLLPNGKVFYSGPSPGSRTFDPATKIWSAVIATTNFGTDRGYGTSVLLPLTPASNYKPRVMIFGGGYSPATDTTEIIDLSAATPAWQFGPSMSQARIEMNATILPNGKVLAIGGSLNDEDTATASLNADLYDPSTNSFSSGGQNAFARLYHSVSLLLPDATVWFAGGNPTRGSYEQHMEIYSPPYLFDASGGPATRPTIINDPASVGYGAAFQIQTPDAASISSIALVRPGAPTHAFDMDQRLISLSFTVGSGVLNATAPPNGNIAPPGYYMLFILNSSGVPSVAKFVWISANPTNQPPTATITSPASDVTITPGQSVFFSGSGSDPNPGGTITAYSWSFPGGSPSSSALANPGNVIYSTPGTYAASLTVTDSLGLTSSLTTRTITVNPATPPTITTQPANQTVTAGQTATFTAAATGSPTPTVQWQVSPDGVTFSNLSGATSTTLSFTTSLSQNGNRYRAVFTNSAGTAPTTAATLTVNPAPSPTINFNSGFSGATTLTLNGGATISGTRLRLTDGGTNEARSAFFNTPVNVQSFTNDFSFQLTSANGDGFTFTIQNSGTTALGSAGGGLGYGPDQPGGTLGIAKSVAVKFDLAPNAGEGTNSTGLYTNGASPTVPSIDMTSSGLTLHSGNVMNVHMTYDGTTLTWTITDPTAGKSFTASATVNIPSVVGGNTALLGFTAGTGGLSATQEILTWSYR